MGALEGRAGRGLGPQGLQEEAQHPGVSGSMWGSQLLHVGLNSPRWGFTGQSGAVWACSSGDKERLKTGPHLPRALGDLALNGGEEEEA